MALPYSDDLRARAVMTYAAGGETYESIAEAFSIGLATINRWLRRKRETGGVAPRPHGGGQPRGLDARGDELLLTLVRAQPDATLVELSERLVAHGGRSVTKSTIARALARLGITRKKRLSSQRSERVIPPACSVGTSRVLGSRTSRTGWSSSTKAG